MAIQNMTDLKALWETGDTIDQTATYNLIESLIQGNRKATIPDAHTELDSGDTDHDVQISAGSAWAANDDYLLKWDSAQVKQIDASWATGTNAGGLSSSLSLAADTWYHLFVFEVSGTVEFGWDTSLTAANLVADHSAGAYRRIASHLTDGSSNILGYTQSGQWFIFATDQIILNTTSPPSSATLTDAIAPHGGCIQLIESQTRSTSSVDIDLYVSNVQANAVHVNRVQATSRYNILTGACPVTSGIQLYVYGSSASWSVFLLRANGYIDTFQV